MSGICGDGFGSKKNVSEDWNDPRKKQKIFRPSRASHMRCRSSLRVEAMKKGSEETGYGRGYRETDGKHDKESTSEWGILID